MTKRRTTVILFLLLLVGVATQLSAQITANGSIRGYIKDEQGGILPGATVVAASPTVGGTHTAVSDAQGLYRLQDLAPGDYTLTAEIQGFSKFAQSGLGIRAGLNLTLDITLKVGTLEETIQVTGESPMLETQKAVQAVNISGEMMARLPTSSRRDWYDVIELTPGVMSRSKDQTGGQVYFSRGTDNENHVVLIDGADMGSFVQNWPSSYLGLSTDAVQDVQMKTGGGDPASPLAQGMVINIATPQGSDVIRGSIGTVFTARKWNDNNDPLGTPALVQLFQPDLSVGGPVVRGRAWFFGATRFTRRNSGISRGGNLINMFKTFVPSWTPFDNKARVGFYYIKGTAQLNQNHQLSFFYQRDGYPEDAGFQYYAGKWGVWAQGGNGYSARLTSVWSQTVTTRLLASYNDKSYNRNWSIWKNYLGSGPSRPVHPSTRRSGATLVGTGMIVTLDNVVLRDMNPGSKGTIGADLTYYKAGWVGSHEFQTGVYLQPILKSEDRTVYSNDGFSQEEVVLRDPNNPAAGYIPFHRAYYDVPGGDTPITTNRVGAHDYAVYAQDSWRPTPRLTINGGVRFDWIKCKELLFDLVLQDHLEIGPSVGGTYVLTADQKNVLRASWGIHHDIPNAGYFGANYLGAATGSASPTRRDLYDLNLDGVFETELVTPGATKASSNITIDPGRRQGYAEDWIVGYQRQLPGNLSVDAAFVRRYYRQRPARVETNAIYENGVFKGYSNEAFNDMFLITSNKWNWFVYSGFEFVVSKRTQKMNVLASYTRAFQHIDGTWQPGDIAGIIQPDTFANNRGLGTIRGNTTNSLGADTRNPMWEKHMMRLAGTYFAPFGLVLSSALTFQSGPDSGPVVTQIAASDPRFGPSTVTLSNGRVVSNPLATTLRFAYADRGIGQVKAPNLLVWNIRVGRDFKFANDRRLELAFDIFNLMNGDTYQQFMSGGNNLSSPNYAIAADGSFRGLNRQPPRVAQVMARFGF